jgi:hypothetical protein
MLASSAVAVVVAGLVLLLGMASSALLLALLSQATSALVARLSNRSLKVDVIGHDAMKLLHEVLAFVKGLFKIIIYKLYTLQKPN